MRVGRNYQKLCLAGLILILAPVLTQAQSYLNDIEANSSSARPMDDHGFPRLILSETKAFKGNMERYTKYHIVTGQNTSKKKVSQIQGLNPDVMYFWHISPRAYQGYLFDGCQTGAGMAFTSSGPTTQGGPPNRGCSIYAGHWLYKAGSKLTQAINATTKTLNVQNASLFQTGQYVVIYNAPAGSFTNAEHARVTARNTTNNTITLAARGFKSVAKSHPSGAIVAQHVVGQGGSPENWSYNMSTQSPRDGNNKTAGQALADWAAANENLDKFGNPINVQVDGIQFDADFYDELKSKKTDANNDLVVDHGISPSGVNWWGLGLEDFYQAMRNRFPSKIIISGNRKARGFSSLNGTQMEAFPAKNRTQPVPTFDDINSQLSRYVFHLHNNKQGPLHTHNLNKTPTTIYPEHAPLNQTGNSIMRLGLGMTLLDDGYFGHENSDIHPDPWYDEFAVNVTPGAANYGWAVASDENNESAVRASLGWLGNPLGERSRIYDSAKFQLSKSLVSNGSFDSNLNGWSGSLVNISRDTSVKKDGSASLRASKMTTYKPDYNQVKVKGPKVSTVKNEEYTLVFSARSTAVREFTAAVGSAINKFIVGTDWRRFVFTFKAKATGQQLISFGVGRENLQMWFDTVHVFKGNANLFRRDFENGAVVVNVTPTSRTVDLGETFQRIKGTQDPINNGNMLTSVTIAPWDAAILVRPDGFVTPPPSDPEHCGQPAYDLASEAGLIIWKTCDGSGRWHIRGIAGGTGTSIRYAGTITATSGTISNLQQFDFEDHDSVSVVNANKRINLSMKMWDGWEDGINFTAADSAEVCFDMSPSNNIIIGKDRISDSGRVCLQD